MAAMNPVLEDLSKLLQDTSSCDFTLRCTEGEKVQVHRLILSARSPVFKDIIETDMKENGNGEVELDCSMEIAKCLVHYIYTGELEEAVEGENTKELLKLGHQYQINNLVDDCGDKIEVTECNVLHLGVFAEMYDAQNLLKTCVKFISENKSILNKTVWELQLKDSPKFLMSVLNMEEDSRGKDVAISRFSEEAVFGNTGYNSTHAITIELNKQATLVSVGVFVTDTRNYIDNFKIQVKNIDTNTEIFNDNPSYRVEKMEIPRQVPVHVNLSPRTKYTVYLNLFAGFHYSGQGGTAVVQGDAGLEVVFSNPPDSDPITNVSQGQIPTLRFQMC